MESTKELVLSYFQSWQKQNWTQMQDCLTSDFILDSGMLQFKNREDFIEFCKEGPRWSQVHLIQSLFQEGQAAILYEGSSLDGHKLKVSEFLTIENGKIRKSLAVISFM